MSQRMWAVVRQLDTEICVHLGLFDTALVKVNRDLAKAAKRLNDLDGRNPMQVVMQRDERNFILGLLKPGAEWTPWIQRSAMPYRLP